MRVLHIAYEFPYPTIHGGRLDTWQHLCGLKALGFPTMHISWAHESMNEQYYNAAKDKAEKVIILRKKGGPKHLIAKFFYLFKYPSLVYDRIISEEEYLEIRNKVSLFKPDIIFLDALYAAELALKLKDDLKLSLIIRSHNIEHLYIAQQFQKSKNLKIKLALLAALLGLKKYEFNIFRKANLIADISNEDSLFWQSQGISHIKWLPPIITNNTDIKTSTPENEKYDITFFGNLNAPNNIDGVKWFCNHVLPIIQKSKDVSVLIMGSSPGVEIFTLASKVKNISVIPDVKDPTEYLNSSRIFINPVRFGSGVKMKTIEMLFSDRQVVSTSEGIKGLPQKEFEDVFFVADTPEKFANCILNILAGKELKSIENRVKLRKEFSIDKLKHILLSTMSI